MSEVAVVVDDVSKRFRLYHERNQSLKSAILRGRRARYDEFWALRDVSFEIPSGLTFGLIGTNGSGKSTLLKCIARILQVDRGRVEVNGKIAALLELGSGFHPELSGRENVFLNGSILGLSKRELTRKFDEIVSFAGVEKFIDTPVKNYSSGMYVRLGFSIAINVDPDILLVDEVLAVGDDAFQRRCLAKFDEFRAAGKTTVLVSHAMGQMREMCNLVAWLDSGELREVGPPGGVVSDYIGRAQTDPLTGSGPSPIVLEALSVLDADHTPTATLRSCEPAYLQLRYRTLLPATDLVFGAEIHTASGVLVAAPDSVRSDALPHEIDGLGHIEMFIDRLPLAPGTYDLSVWVGRRGGGMYGKLTRQYRFVVEADPNVPARGVVALGGEWRFMPAAVPNPQH